MNIIADKLKAQTQNPCSTLNSQSHYTTKWLISSWSAIRSGDYPPGARIPSEPLLAKDYGIGRPTVRQAIGVLVRKRLLLRRRGAGTYVRTEEQELDLFSLAGTSSAFHKRGHRDTRNGPRQLVVFKSN